MAWTASLDKGQSFDEGLQLAVGYNIWLNDDLRIEGANGDFVKRWATLPYLITRPQFVGKDDRFWKTASSYELAHRFFFQVGNRPEWLLSQSRAMIALLGAATGLLVYIWAAEMFGRVGGFLSLGLFVFNPHMLAFGGIVSTDMSIVLTLFAATWCIWRLLHRVTWSRICASLGVFGLLVLAKPTALVILPITAVLIAVKLLVRRPLLIRLRAQSWLLVRRRTQLAVFAGLIALHAVAGWSAIWAHYSFRYDASPDPDDPSLKMFALEYRDGVSEPLRDLLRWLNKSHVLPEGFHRGVHSLAGNDDETVSFMNGKWRIGGQPEFFPYAIWVKTTPALFVLLLAGSFVWWRQRRAVAGAASGSKVRFDPAPSLYAASPLLALIICYLGVAMTENLNIGHRHVLPIYPALLVLAGAVGLIAARMERAKKAALVGIALAWPAAESLAMRPNYLAYFGPQAGGPDEGYNRLVDSSLDWGMALPGLAEWLKEHDPQSSVPLFLGYFGTDSPTYHGIRAHHRLPGFFDRRPVEAYPLSPGYYAISATLIQSLYTVAFGPWSKAYEERYQLAYQNMREFEQTASSPQRRAALLQGKPQGFWTTEIHIYDYLRFARLCAWLRHTRAPDDHVDHSILIWKLSFADLQAALLGPAVELTDDPLPTRHYGRHISVRG